MILSFPLDPRKLPEKAGVYLFLDKNKKPIYIGKAVNLKNRIRSHQRNQSLPDAAAWPGSKKNPFKPAKFLRFEILDSEIAALIKESKLIKKYRPKLNVALKDDKKYFYLCFSDETFPRVSVRHQQKGDCLGPFVDGKALKNSLALVRKSFAFCSCKTPHRRQCLNAQIGLCFGFCCAKDHWATKKEVEQYQKNIAGIKRIFSGRDKGLKKEIAKELSLAVKNEDFDAAQKLKLQFQGLEKVFSHRQHLYEEQIFDVRELEKIAGAKPINRIEFYDLSQLQGSSRVAAMTVWQNDNYDKKQWRLFKIRNEKALDDLAMLKEVLERRQNHLEWPKPDLAIIDGGKNQLKTAKNTIKDSRIKIWALQKNAKHAPQHLLILQKDRKSAQIISLVNISKPLKNFLEDFSEKTHSFAIRFHRKRRDKIGN